MTSLTRRGLIGASLAGAGVAVSTPPTFAASRQRLELVDPATGLAGASSRAVALSAELVRQWRQSLGKSIDEAGGAVSLARWDKTLILSGLARENGWRVRVDQVQRGLYRTDISRA